MGVNVGRAYSFRAVHQLTVGPVPERTHGHAYRIEVTLTGPEFDGLDRVVREHVLPLVNGRRLGEPDGAPFGPSTGEVLVEWIDRTLRASPIGPRLCAVILFETAKNRFASARTEERYV